MTKSELQECLIEVQTALRQERNRSRTLLRENRRLAGALRTESERFTKLYDYIKTFRKWVTDEKGVT